MTRTCAFLLWLAILVFAGACGHDATGPRETSPPNTRPSIAAQRDTVCSLGDTLRLHAEASDIDHDALVFSVVVIASREEILNGYRIRSGLNPRTGDFWFTPGGDDQPHRSFKFIVDDGEGGSDSTAFTVRVTHAN